jgi:hypothetical protein
MENNIDKTESNLIGRYKIETNSSDRESGIVSKLIDTDGMENLTG